MEQMHKRFTAEQVKVLLKGYCQGTLDRDRLAIEEILGIGKTRFFALLRQYRQDPDNFALAYQRGTNAEISDFVATVVVKTPRARRIRDLCGLQTVPARNSHPQMGSLVCAAITGGRPVLWRSTHIEDPPAVLVRPLLSVGREPYGVILLAIPNEEFSMISFQAEMIEPIPVNGDVSCPFEKRCRNSHNCIWRDIGDYYEY